MSKRICLMGNRQLATDSLRLLRERFPETPLLVVLNPSDDGVDGPGGTSLRRLVEEAGIAHIQPKHVKSAEAREQLAAFAPDLILSCSYEKIVPEEVIRIPKDGALNVHYAALPLNRGCFPVVWTIASGEAELGVTLHEMTPGIDDGPILAQRRLPYQEGMTAGEAYRACAQAAVQMVGDFLTRYISDGIYGRQAQNEAAATYHSAVHPYERWIPWHRGATEVARVINALTYVPHPSGRTCAGAESKEIGLLGPAFAVNRRDLAPGQVELLADCAFIGTADGAVRVTLARVGDAAVPVSNVLSGVASVTSPYREIYPQ